MQDTKQQILEAAIVCIERKGLPATTTRDIAAEAGVNVAAINYHFQRKDRLLDLAMSLTVENGMRRFRAILETPGRGLAERLVEFFLSLLRGGSTYPNLARAHFYHALIEGGPPGPYPIQLSELLRDTIERASEGELGRLSRTEVALRLETGLRAGLMLVIGGRMVELTDSANSFADEAVHLVQLALPHAGWRPQRPETP